jgi:hypothetical protein
MSYLGPSATLVLLSLFGSRDGSTGRETATRTRHVKHIWAAFTLDYCLYTVIVNV